MVTVEGRIPDWTVSDRLRKARESAGLEQAELAQEIGVSKNTVSNYERGTVSPRRPVLVAWALATGVALDWLVRPKGLEPPTFWTGVWGLAA